MKRKEIISIIKLSVQEEPAFKTFYFEKIDNGSYKISHDSGKVTLSILISIDTKYGMVYLRSIGSGVKYLMVENYIDVLREEVNDEDLGSFGDTFRNIDILEKSIEKNYGIKKLYNFPLESKSSADVLVNYLKLYASTALNLLPNYSMRIENVVKMIEDHSDSFLTLSKVPLRGGYPYSSIKAIIIAALSGNLKLANSLIQVMRTWFSDNRVKYGEKEFQRNMKLIQLTEKKLPTMTNQQLRNTKVSSNYSPLTEYITISRNALVSFSDSSFPNAESILNLISRKSETKVESEVEQVIDLNLTDKEELNLMKLDAAWIIFIQNPALYESFDLASASKRGKAMKFVIDSSSTSSYRLSYWENGEEIIEYMESMGEIMTNEISPKYGDQIQSIEQTIYKVFEEVSGRDLHSIKEDEKVVQYTLE